MKYDYKCKSCGEEFSKNLPMAEREAPLSEKCFSCGKEGSIIQVIGATPMIYDRAGAYRTTDSFNDRLKEIKKNSGRDNTIITR